MPYPNELAPLSVIPGAIRFNTDSMKLEYYRGGPVGFGTTTQTGEWVNLTTDSPDIQTGGTRGVFGGGEAPTGPDNTINYVTISTTGNAIDFGDLTVARRLTSSASSATRGLWLGGRTGVPAENNTIDFITISSTGNAQDFGDITRGTSNNGLVSLSNSTRALSCGPTTTLDYVTIASTGNAQDFGDVTDARESLSGTSDNTRGIFAGGYPNTNTNLIEFVIIQSMGNAFDFGDLITATREFGACSNGHGGLG